MVRWLRDEHVALVIVDAQQLPVSMIRVADHGPLPPPPKLFEEALPACLDA